MTVKLTLTQSLAAEVLMSRHRLGEGLWTFERRARPALLALEDLGLVSVLDSEYAPYTRATLTAEGIKEFTGADYVSPVELELRVLKAELADIRRLRDVGR